MLLKQFLNLNDRLFVHVEIPIQLKQMGVNVGAYRALGINALCLCTGDKAVVPDYFHLSVGENGKTLFKTFCLLILQQLLLFARW